MAKKAVARRKTTAVANLKEELRQEASQMQERVGSGESTRIRTSDKVFEMPNGEVVDGSMECVIIDFTSKNALYEGKWDPNNPQPPICFAIGDIIDAMKPSPKSPEPQADSCANCPMNEFGSDGNGKACKNTRTLAVVPANGNPEAPMMTLDVSPTGLKSFDGHVSTVTANFGLPPICVVTEVGFHPEKSWAQLMFSSVEENQNLEVHAARREEARRLISQEPNMTVNEAPKAKSRARGGRGRARARK